MQIFRELGKQVFPKLKLSLTTRSVSGEARGSLPDQTLLSPSAFLNVVPLNLRLPMEGIAKPLIWGLVS